MESGDLVVVKIGGNESLRGEAARDFPDMTGIQPELLESVHVGRTVVADGGHDQRFTAQQFQVVGNVAGAAAEFSPHVRHQKGDIEDVDLLGQDVILEAVAEYHDGVVGHRTADKCFHAGFQKVQG
jgi:hypothetical protein